MNRTGNTWTTLELELYHDGELNAARQTELSYALRCDADLRERLAGVERVDHALQSAFASEHHAPHHVTRHPHHTMTLFSRPTLVAACVLLAVAGTGWFISRAQTSAPNTLARQHRQTIKTTPSKGKGYQAVRVVLSLPVKTRAQETSDDAANKRTTQVAKAKPPTESLARFYAGLDYELATGRIERTADLLRDAPAGRRGLAYRHVGLRLRSQDVAEQILDRLSPREQLAVCVQWAHVAVVRATVLARLQRLSTEPALAGEVRAVVTELARDTRLRSWCRAYQLVACTDAKNNRSG